MAYVYLLKLYEEIEKRLQEIYLLSQQKTERSPYQQGRIDLLKEFRVYLSDNMNNKLPKRIRKRLAGKI